MSLFLWVGRANKKNGISQLFSILGLSERLKQLLLILIKMNKKKVIKKFSPYGRKKNVSSPYKKGPTGTTDSSQEKSSPTGSFEDQDTLIRLNKFVANSGVCSRREADNLIAEGVISVNGKIVTELGTKVKPTDVVVYNGKKLQAEKKVYVLLNKPKDYITTATDPQGRRTVMDLVKGAGDQRIFPVGRLDRNTTGLLIMTNDGELTKRLTHPKHGVKKLYHVQLDKPLTRNDFVEIQNGVDLDDERIVPDEMAYTGKDNDRTQVGIKLHSGQNRIVRRIFESYDYKVVRLDRVMVAGLTKKDLPRGHWRFLTEKEVNFLMMIK